MDFWRKIAKEQKQENWAYQAPTLQRREPTLRRRPTLRNGIPRRVEAEVPKMALLEYATT